MPWYSGSQNYLLARFTDRAGAVITNSSPSGTSVAVTLTDPSGVVRVNAVSMTYDGAFVATDPADGQSKTGWWTYLPAATVFPKRGTYRQKVVASISGTPVREATFDMIVRDRG